MKIGTKVLGAGRTYIISEFGVNHNGSLERAKEAIVKAAQAGADAIKFQTYKADDLVVKGTPKFWKSEGGDIEGNQYDAYKALGGEPLEWYPELIACCEENGIEFLSTAFSFEAADYLNSIGMKAFKIASSDMSTIPFLKHIARYQKPIILSTGAADMSEIKEAVAAIEGEGNDQIILLQCTLCYPTKEEDANFAVLNTFKKKFPFYTIGLSDHTLGAFSALVGIAMGAQVIEKHYTVDKTLGDSADHWLSVDPTELKEIVDGARRIEALRGSSEKQVINAEKETRMYDKRSIVSKVDLLPNVPITLDMLTFKRPGTGIHPRKFEMLNGKIPKELVKADTTLDWNHFYLK